MARTGPVTKDTSTVVLGLAQIRLGASASNIDNPHTALTSDDSIGALANTRFVGNADYFRLESGFPLKEDYTIAIRESAALECSFKEITPKNLAWAFGNDASSGYEEAHSGEVALGNRTSPDYVRMEAQYTYPNGTNYMYIIFPRANVSASVEIDFTSEDAAAIPIMVEAKNADSEVSGGHSVWDDKPLGRIYWT